MQTEDKFLTLGILFALAVGGSVLLSRSHAAPAQKASPETALPVGASRALLLGENYPELVNCPCVLIEFGDYQCPPCRLLYDSLQNFAPLKQGKVALVFRHYPLTEIHPDALNAARAAEAAREQGAFWPMHDLLYAHYGKSDAKSIAQYAAQLNLNLPRLETAMRTTAQQRITRDTEAANQLRISGTPTLILCSPDAAPRLVRFEDLPRLLR